MTESDPVLLEDSGQRGQPPDLLIATSPTEHADTCYRVDLYAVELRTQFQQEIGFNECSVALHAHDWRAEAMLVLPSIEGLFGRCDELRTRTMAIHLGEDCDDCRAIRCREGGEGAKRGRGPAASAVATSPCATSRHRPRPATGTSPHPAPAAPRPCIPRERKGGDKERG